MDNIFLRCISSAKSISAHFFLLNHQGPLCRQTHNTFAVKRSLNKCQNKLISIFPLVMDKKNLSTLTPILSNVFARQPISVLDRYVTCQCFKKTERLARFYKKIEKTRLQSFPWNSTLFELCKKNFQNEISQNFV